MNQHDRISYSVDEAAMSLGISRSQVYNLVNRAEIKTFKIGARRMISANELKAYVAAREKDAQ